MDTKRKLARLGWPLVGAGEVADEDFSEIYPAVDAVGLQAVQPCPGRALEHERNVLHSNVLFSVFYVDGCGVVYRPVIRLHRAIVLGSVSREREPFEEGLVANAGGETRRADCIFFFKRQGSGQAVDPVAGVIFSYSLMAA